MKRILILSLAITLLYSCTKTPTRQEIAQENIKAYLMEHLNDTSGYQSISFDTITPLYSSYLDDQPFEIDTFIRTFKEEKRIDDSLKKNHKPKKLGLYVIHKFRAKNGFNASILNEKKFTLDSNLKVIGMIE